MDNKTMLLVLMIVLIVFIVLLAVLGVVFIVALRKRAPVVKVVMAPLAAQPDQEEEPRSEPEPQLEVQKDTAVSDGASDAQAVPPPVVPEPDEDEDEDEQDEPVFVTEGQERVRYDRSLTAKLCQLKNETKEWYSELKNELLSYEKVKDRMSWRRETYRIGRMTVARLVIRGRTLCLMLAVEPSGYAGTKYAVEDVSNVAATADTPTLYRIKSVRRLKYAKEMLAGIMKELKIYKDPRYVAQDFFTPYEGDMALMQRGLVKRVVSGTTRTFKIEEVDPIAKAQTEPEAAATKNSEAPTSDDK